MGMEVWRNIGIVGLLINLGFFRSLGQFQGPWISFRVVQIAFLYIFVIFCPGLSDQIHPKICLETLRIQSFFSRSFFSIIPCLDFEPRPNSTNRVHPWKVLTHQPFFPGIQTQVTKENRRWRKQKQKSLAEVHPGETTPVPVPGLGSLNHPTHPRSYPKKMGPWVFLRSFFCFLILKAVVKRCFFSRDGRVKNHGDVVDVWGTRSSWYRCFLDHLLFEARKMEAFLKIIQRSRNDDFGGGSHWRKTMGKLARRQFEKCPVGPVGLGERNYTKSLSVQIRSPFKKRSEELFKHWLFTKRHPRGISFIIGESRGIAERVCNLSGCVETTFIYTPIKEPFESGYTQ